MNTLSLKWKRTHFVRQFRRSLRLFTFPPFKSYNLYPISRYFQEARRLRENNEKNSTSASSKHHRPLAPTPSLKSIVGEEIDGLSGYYFNLDIQYRVYESIKG